MKQIRPGLIWILFIVYSLPLKSQNWYKGNLHTHSLWSDGDSYPEMIMDWYKTHGYHFVGLSDHNILQEGTKWKVLTSAKDRAIFKHYLNNYGPSWVSYKIEQEKDTLVRLKTLKEYRRRFEQGEKFMIFRSEEITSNSSGLPIHMVATNIEYGTGRYVGNNPASVIQTVIDKIDEQKEKTGKAIMLQLCHPNFEFAVTADDIIKVNNLRFFELFNGVPYTYNYGDETHDSTEVIWDKVNVSYVKAGKPLLLGVGVDDAHNFYNFKPESNNPGRAWVVVNAPKLDPDTIVKSLNEGKFYVSTGVELKSIDYDAKEISLEVMPRVGVNYIIQFIGVKKGKEKSEVIKEVRDVKASCELDPHYLFIRAKVVSSKLKKNSTLAEEMETAWTQPFIPL